MGECSLEWTAGFGGSLDFGLTLLGHFTDLLLVKGVGGGHEKNNLSFVHEGSTDFIQLFEIGTQSLVGLCSCAAGDGDVVGFLGSGDFVLTNALDFEAGAVKCLTNGSAGDFYIFALGGNKCGHAREHYLVDAFHFLQSQTGFVCSASPTTAKGYIESLDG